MNYFIQLIVYVCLYTWLVVGLGYGQCGKQVFNPETGLLDCTGVMGNGGGVGGAAALTTAGAIPLVSSAGTLTQDGSNFFWDNTNKRLGIGTASPVANLDVVGWPSQEHATLRVEQYATAVGAYGIEIHTYADNASSPTPGTGARTGLVIHNYSDLGPAMQIDQVRSGALLSLKNTANNATANGSKGTGPFLEFVGYGASDPNSVISLGVLNKDLQFYSYDQKYSFMTGLDVQTGFASYATAGAPSTSGSAATENALRASSTSTLVSIDAGVSNSPTYGWIQARSRTNYATNYNLALQPNGGSVGIATASPGALLDVYSTFAGANGIRISGDSTTRTLYLKSNGVIEWTGGSGGWVNAIQYKGGSGTNILQQGVYGANDTLNYWYAGTAYNATWLVLKSASTGIGYNNTAPTGTLSIVDRTATTGATLEQIGTDGTDTSATTTRQVIRAGQVQSTTKLTEWQANAGGVIAAVGPGGGFITAATAAETLANSQCTFHLASNTQLTFTCKGSDGTLRTNTLTLI